MKTPRVLAVFFLLVCTLFGGALTGVLGGGSTPAQAVDVNDFTFLDWKYDMKVSVDAQKHAQAHVRETVTVKYDDKTSTSRGFVRALYESNQNQPVNLRNVRVTDENGTPTPFFVDKEEGFWRINLGDDTTYVYGEHTYVIDYDLSNVMQVNPDEKHGDVAELYWTPLPIRHSQVIENFSAKFTFSEPLAKKLLQQHQCYRGEYESTDRCELTVKGAKYAVPPMRFGPNETMTVAIGMKHDAIAEPPNYRFGKFVNAVKVPATVGLIIAGTGMLFAYVVASFTVGKSRMEKEFGPIIAQYEVPPEMPPPLTNIPMRNDSSIAPEILHLAVNNCLKLVEEEDPKAHGKKKKKKLKIVKCEMAPGMSPLDELAHRALFEKRTEIDTSTESGRNHLRAVGSRLAAAANHEAGKRSFSRISLTPLWLFIPSVLVTLASVFMLVASLVVHADSPWVFLISIALSIFGCLPYSKLQGAGLKWRHYLLGVKEFIRVAERDRINMLQSYTGALRQPDGQVDRIQLYEKLLPYAMVFGLEKSWVSQLQSLYDRDGRPVPWTTGNVASLSRSLKTLSEASRTPTSSSMGGSSSASSGGGFSGGGGGGGYVSGR